MFKDIKFNKLYEEDGGGGGNSSSGVLKISSTALSTASDNYAKRAKEILLKLTGNEEFSADTLDGVTGGVAGNIKTMIDNGYWDDANGQKYLEAANSVLEDILKAAKAVNQNATFLKNVATYVADVSSDVNTQVSNILTSSSN